MIPPMQFDLGQGVLHIIEDIHHELNPDMHNAGGYLLKDQP
jgi:UDP-glucose 4-epimerase